MDRITTQSERNSSTSIVLKAYSSSAASAVARKTERALRKEKATNMDTSRRATRSW